MKTFHFLSLNKYSIALFHQISRKIYFKKHEVLAAPEKIERKKWL